MKLNQREKATIAKANAKLKEQTAQCSYKSELHRADKWSRANVFKNRKAYSRKQKHKKEY